MMVVCRSAKCMTRHVSHVEKKRRGKGVGKAPVSKDQVESNRTLQSDAVVGVEKMSSVLSGGWGRHYTARPCIQLHTVAVDVVDDYYFICTPLRPISSVEFT